MQRNAVGILFLTLIGLGLLDLTPAEVTHEEIRGNIQSLIYSYNQLDNKLERHEHRERALGELLKKAMQTLQKGQKSLEPITEIYGRLDERISQIETILITQEEKYNLQTEKLGEALEHMFKWMRENNECFKRPPVLAGATAPAPTSAVTPEFVKHQEQTNKVLMDQIKKLSDNVEKLLDNSKDMMEQTEVTFRSVPSTAEMLTKIEDKLISYNVEAPTVATLATTLTDEFTNKVFEKFAEIKKIIAELLAAPKTQQGLTSADKEFIHGLANETLTALEKVKTDAVSAADKALANTSLQIKDSSNTIETNINKVFEGITSSTDALQKFHKDMNATYNKFNDGLEIFSKFNNILMTNSEYVLDTQRKVEFGTIQIVQKLGDLLERQRDGITALIKEEFDNLNETIIANQIDSMQNLSALIETEIGHVWRQISIMNDEITDSKDLLNLMQGRNEVYVNSTFSSMDSMSTKVEEIKSRMLDMDSNLNFLLGKLSLLSQEFNNIKLGLADSLQELRTTFQQMNSKLPQNTNTPVVARTEQET